MNPNKHLAAMRQVIAEHATGEVDQRYMRRRVTELFVELDAWLSDGGALPNAWDDALSGGETSGAWAVGLNTAGYLPEADVLTFATWEEAKDAYVAMCHEWADSDDESFEDGQPDSIGSSRACVDSILSDPSFPLVSEEDYVMRVNPNGMLHPIPTVLWLAWSDDATLESE